MKPSPPAQKRSSDAAPTRVPMLIGGSWRHGSETSETRDPYRGTVVAHVPRSSTKDLNDALDAAVEATAKAAATPAYERAALLRRAGTILVERADRIAEIMTRETGKAIKDAKAEVVRSQDTLALSAEEAVRIEGAKVLAGGKRHGAQIGPTVLASVNPTMKVVCEEVFGPVVSLLPYDDIDQAFRAVSDSRFGLQTGIFTKSMEIAIRAVRSLRTGGVIINGTSTWRTDQLAYGGVKDSGIGREGPRYSIRDMTEERMVLFNL